MLCVPSFGSLIERFTSARLSLRRFAMILKFIIIIWQSPTHIPYVYVRCLLAIIWHEVIRRKPLWTKLKVIILFGNIEIGCTEKKRGGGERKKEETEYSKTVRAVHSPMDGQILMHFVLFFYFFLNEIWQLRMVEQLLVSTPFPMWKEILLITDFTLPITMLRHTLSCTRLCNSVSLLVNEVLRGFWNVYAFSGHVLPFWLT